MTDTTNKVAADHRAERHVTVLTGYCADDAFTITGPLTGAYAEMRGQRATLATVMLFHQHWESTTDTQLPVEISETLLSYTLPDSDAPEDPAAFAVGSEPGWVLRGAFTAYNAPPPPSRRGQWLSNTEEDDRRMAHLFSLAAHLCDHMCLAGVVVTYRGRRYRLEARPAVDDGTAEDPKSLPLPSNDANDTDPSE